MVDRVRLQKPYIGLDQSCCFPTMVEIEDVSLEDWERELLLVQTHLDFASNAYMAVRTPDRPPGCVSCQSFIVTSSTRVCLHE